MATLFSFFPLIFNSASPITKEINHAIFWTAPLLKKAQKAKNPFSDHCGVLVL
jgi:hypothetical protein